MTPRDETKDPHTKSEDAPDEDQRTEDFERRHESSEKKPLPKRTGDMDPPGMEPETEADR